MFEIIVPEHALGAARIADARDHARVVERVGEDHAAGQQLRQRGKRRVVGDVAAGEDQRRFLAVQVGEFRLQLDMVVRVAADIARAARSRADIVQRLFHRRGHLGVLTHRQIVVGAPHGDRLRAVVAVEAARVGVGTLVAQDIDEDPIPALFVQAIDRPVEYIRIVRHGGAPFIGRKPQFPARSLRAIRKGEG